jgi:hypothetical protein
MPDVMADRRDAPRCALILVAEITEIATAVKDGANCGCQPDPLLFGRGKTLPQRHNDPVAPDAW